MTDGHADTAAGPPHVELTGRLVAAAPTRIVEVGSRVVQRREAILQILTAAYTRDQRGRVNADRELL